MALVGYAVGENQAKWACGGTLISDQYVLTAAHCIFTRDGEPKYVRLGDLNILKNDDDADPEDFNVAQAIPHPSYKPPSVYDDIGLIKLDHKVQFNPYKKPACLPASFEEKQNLLSASVWDQPQFGEDISGHLQNIILEKIPTEKCNETYGELSYRKLLSKGIISKQICAGPKYQSKDTCQGDSGGPIQVFHPSIYCMYTVVRVTSFGIACGAIGVPGVYTRVHPYVDWIESIVWG